MYLQSKFNRRCIHDPHFTGRIFAFSIIQYDSLQIPGLGFVADILTEFLEWVEDNPAQGAVAFAAVYVFTTICFIPGSLLTLGSGLVFGRALGTGLGVLVGSVAVLVSFGVVWVLYYPTTARSKKIVKVYLLRHAGS